MALRVVKPRDGGLISLDEAKAQLRIDHDEDDDLIIGAIAAATDQVEANTQRRYLPQSLQWVRQDWGDHMVLPVAPGGDSQGIEVTGIQYADENGDTQTLDPSIYWAKPCGDTRRVSFRWYQIWPWLGDAEERLVISFDITGASTVSFQAKLACKLLVSHWYENRDAVVGVDNRDSSTPLPLGVEQLLSPDRWSA